MTDHNNTPFAPRFPFNEEHAAPESSNTNDATQHLENRKHANTDDPFTAGPDDLEDTTDKDIATDRPRPPRLSEHGLPDAPTGADPATRPQASVNAEKTAQWLMRRYARAHELPDPDDQGWTTTNAPWNEITRWLVDTIAPGLRWSSWNQYRWAINKVTGDMYRDRMRVNRKSRITTNHNRIKRERARRAKRVTNDDIRAIRPRLVGPLNKPQWGELAWIWLNATLHTGLRPIEWLSAYIQHTENGPQLITTTAKKTREERLDPETEAKRTIPIDHLSRDQIARINALITNLQAYPEQFTHIQRSVRTTLKRATLKAWPGTQNTIQLYSARHQFKENLQAAGYSQPAIAALMGHTSLETQFVYGQAGTGSTDMPAPNHPNDESSAWR